MSKVLALLAGPTASGKSQLALDLAGMFDGVIINADSMQVYRDLRILTARPGPDELARAPHRLYGTMSATERCSAARWRDLAVVEIEAAWAAGQLPLVVGGTGLYLRALTQGLAPIPDVPPAVRRAAQALHERLGGAAFRARLAARDPVVAARLHDGDTQRLIRAFEVLEATGTSLAEWQDLKPDPPAVAAPMATLVLDPPRDWLYRRCERRFEAMVADGALDEVAAIEALELDPSLPAMKALGVPELRRHLAGDCDLPTAIAAAQQATRRYAKRQITWFRHQMPDAQIITDTDPEQRLVQAAISLRNLIAEI